MNKRIKDGVPRSRVTIDSSIGTRYRGQGFASLPGWLLRFTQQRLSRDTPGLKSWVAKRPTDQSRGISECDSVMLSQIAKQCASLPQEISLSQKIAAVRASKMPRSALHQRVHYSFHSSLPNLTTSACSTTQYFEGAFPSSAIRAAATAALPMMT